ncbi:MAG TPA: DUF3014 domain-containing protein [Steroidobacteraceae bacterium]|jgi:hypothetical protein|nr:DUF3014 domain-containing protein [Steroidobacteraceae bacterium]
MVVNKPMIAVAAVVVAVGLGAAYYWHSRSTQSASVPVAAQQTPPPSEPAIEHPVPQPGESASNGPLPSLAESDPAMKDALSHLTGSDAVMQYLVPDSIIRHIVVTIDNLPRQKVAVSKRPAVSPAGTFLADGDELHATIDPNNFARYQPMVDVVRGLDIQQVSQVYLRFYPLFQHVYQDLGYPNGYFNDRLVQVIDSLLATPQPTDPIELTRPNVMYVYADPTLEARPAGQKLLLRMGPENEAVIKAKLKELRTVITAAPPKH